MGLPIDTSKALRGTTDLQRLVEGVIAASDHDELDWIEWKSTLSLTTKEGCFAIVRTVLGMGNRWPAPATLPCEGLGYIIVGAEPGTAAGVASVDPAQLSQRIEPYLGGADGPRWTPTFLSIQGKTVLVVSIEPPRPGDPIFTLRREFDSAPNGAIFIRKNGRTERADSADIDALQRRLTATRDVRDLTLDVALTGDVPLSWFQADTITASVERLADGRHRELADRATATERAQAGVEGKDVDIPGMASLRAALTARTAALRLAGF